MNTPHLTNEQVHPAFESKFLNVYGLEYIEGKQYMNATRRGKADLAALKDEASFKSMLPDAVSCIVIVKGEKPRLLLTYEFRYPLGQYVLSIPAGLIDPADKLKSEPILETAKRELKEEANIELSDKDSIFTVSPLLFSTPGMTDESNALVCVIIDDESTLNLSHEGAEGTEMFEDFFLLDKAEATRILKQGRDDRGIFYSMYTWAALIYFISDSYLL